MELLVAADYRGFKLKKKLLSFLKKEGYEPTDLGCYDTKENDYNDSAVVVARAVRRNLEARGILICDSAHGMNIQANRFKGIRACNCDSEESAKMAREHDNDNILCLSAHFTDEEAAKKIVTAFLTTKFEPIERRLRRVNRLDERADYD